MAKNPTVNIQIGNQTVAASSVALPETGRTFREAWSLGDQAIEVDMPKARILQKEVIRADRVAAFQTADTDFMRSIEDGNTAAKKKASDYKKKLRAVTDDPRIEEAETATDLSALTLEYLI